MSLGVYARVGIGCVWNEINPTVISKTSKYRCFCKFFFNNAIAGSGKEDSLNFFLKSVDILIMTLVCKSCPELEPEKYKQYNHFEHTHIQHNLY